MGATKGVRAARRSRCGSAGREMPAWRPAAPGWLRLPELPPGALGCGSGGRAAPRALAGAAGARGADPQELTPVAEALHAAAIAPWLCFR